MSRVVTLVCVTALLATSRVMEGQVSVGKPDSAVLHVRPDASHLDSLELTYIATLQHDTTTRSIGERSVQLHRTMYAGQQAWEIVETHGAGANASVDTLIADFDTLTPLHWGATQQMPTTGTSAAAARVSIEFRADSMIGVITAPSGRRTILAPMPGGALLTASQTETALRALPISAGWRDSLSVVVTDLAKTTVVQAELAVTGEEQIVTPAGSYDCWRLTLSTDVGQTRYWVGKSDRIVVKTSQMLPESGDTLEYTLTRITH